MIKIITIIIVVVIIMNIYITIIIGHVSGATPFMRKKNTLEYSFVQLLITSTLEERKWFSKSQKAVITPKANYNSGGY